MNPTKALGGIITSEEVVSMLCGRDSEGVHLFGAHTDPIAGGNVIAARNRDGQLKFIVGEFALYGVWHAETFGSVAQITGEEFEGRTFWARSEKHGYDPEQYLLWKNAKQRIRKTLLGDERARKAIELGESTKKSVLFVPQCAYHIDMVMLYAAPGVMAIHSFEKQRALVESCADILDDEAQGLLETISGLEETYGPVMKKAAHILEKHGFEVVEVAGTFPLHIENGHFNEGPERNQERYFNFFNGIALHERKVLVVHNDDDDPDDPFPAAAFKRFKKALAHTGVAVVPVGGHLDFRVRLDENAFMYVNGGGLRCKMTTLPMGYAEHLERVASVCNKGERREKKPSGREKI
ncbi:MAG: hypothetical protein QM820_03115 [Minicystis sp.]